MVCLPTKHFFNKEVSHFKFSDVSFSIEKNCMCISLYCTLEIWIQFKHKLLISSNVLQNFLVSFEIESKMLGDKPEKYSINKTTQFYSTRYIFPCRIEFGEAFHNSLLEKPLLVQSSKKITPKAHKIHNAQKTKRKKMATKDKGNSKPNETFQASFTSRT